MPLCHAVIAGFERNTLLFMAGLFVLTVDIFFRILGNRVSELEKKLKTLEVAGLWSVSGIHLLLICISHLIYLVQSHSCAASLSER